jgi:hypothetical protein
MLLVKRYLGWVAMSPNGPSRPQGVLESYVRFREPPHWRGTAEMGAQRKLPLLPSLPSRCRLWVKNDNSDRARTFL